MSKKLTKKQKKEAQKFFLANWKVIVAIVLLVAILLTIAYFMGWLDFLFKKDDEEIVLSTAGGYETSVDSFDPLKVEFLNVGQADSIFIVLPDGKNMLIDSGDSSSDRQLIANALQKYNMTKINYLLLTHSDQDHVGNMDWVLKNYDVNFIFRPNIYSNNNVSADLPSDFNIKSENSKAFVCTTKIYANFMVEAYAEGCTTEIFNKDSDFENKMILGSDTMSYKFDFLTPTASRTSVAYSEPNNYSPILMLEYAGRKIMFNGDAELETLNEYLTTYHNLNNVDILKVGHHGSRNATTMDYIEAIDPEYAVIQNGIDKSYLHPHKETLEILSTYDGGVTLYRNDTNGNLTLTITSSGNIDWEMENTDMSNNWLDGTEMLELKESGKLGNNFKYNENKNFGDLLRIFTECRDYKKEEIVA